MVAMLAAKTVEKKVERTVGWRVGWTAAKKVDLMAAMLAERKVVMLAS